MTDDNGEIYKDKVALVKELAKKIGEINIVVQCPRCGEPHEKVWIEDLSTEITENPCEECQKRLEAYMLPVRRLR